MLKYKKLAYASYKKEQRQKEVPSFSFLLFGHPTGKFASLFRGQHHSTNVNYFLYSKLGPKVTGALSHVGSDV